MRIEIALKDINITELYFDKECRTKIPLVKRLDILHKRNVPEKYRYESQEDWGYFD